MCRAWKENYCIRYPGTGTNRRQITLGYRMSKWDMCCTCFWTFCYRIVQLLKKMLSKIKVSFCVIRTRPVSFYRIRPTWWPDPGSQDWLPFTTKIIVKYLKSKMILVIFIAYSTLSIFNYFLHCHPLCSCVSLYCMLTCQIVHLM